MMRFTEDVWRPFYDMVVHKVEAGEPIEPSHRYAAHERVILSQVAKLPGVYVRVSPEATGWFYLGEAGKIGTRSKDHLNSALFLARVYVTMNKETAKRLETSLFHQLEKTGFIVQRQKPESPITRQGALRVPKDIDPVKVLDSLVDGVYKEFCRAKVGITS